jgi:RNA polymerase sigma-70 factor (ECF subfamily)
MLRRKPADRTDGDKSAASRSAHCTGMSTLKRQLAGSPHRGVISGTKQERGPNVIGLVHQYSAMLNRVARSITRNTSEADDIVQETFLRVLRHQNDLAELRDARTWLIRITWNLALDRKRRAKTRPQSDDFEKVARCLPVSELSAEAVVIAAERHARMLLLIDTLPAREREVLLLSAVKELSTVEIALVLKTTDSTIRSLLYRARQALRVLIEAEWELEASRCHKQAEE